MKTDANPLPFTTNTRFKTFAYRVILLITLHWSVIAPAQPLIDMTIDVYGKEFNDFFTPDVESILDEESESFVVDTKKDTTAVTAEIESVPEPIKLVTEPTVAVKTEKKRLTTKPSSSFEGGVFPADLLEGRIGISKQIPLDNPSDNLFVIQIDNLPELDVTDKVVLKYELEGVQGKEAVSRSINGRPAFGGYMVKATKGWTTQEEELNSAWLASGKNEILFTTPAAMTHQYTIKNVRVEIERGSLDKVQSLVVLDQDAVRMTKDNQIYIKGFVKGQHEGALTVLAGNTALRVSGDEFEGLVSVEDIKDKNNILSIRANDAVGLLGQELIILENHLMEADRLYDLGTANYQTTVSATIAEQNEAFGFAIDTRGDAFAKANIAVTKLRSIDIAPLESGMRNVTKGSSAYRMSPLKDQNAEEPFKLALAFNPEMIPNGYTARDIQTFYFNKKEKGWKTLPKDSLDLQKNVLISYLTVEETNGGTDYINGVIQTPEASTTSSFMPTMMSDIKAVNPSAAMTIIAPPSVSQRGNANISYPIRIPAGRNGMQPSVGLSYSNEGGNGWLGLGWSMSMPSVSLDTRWGVPTFDPNGESELYSLGGEMLMYPDNFLPHRHEGDDPANYDTTLQERGSEIKIFTPRKQGSFAKIERLGGSTSTYYWKVTDASGTISWYGGDDTGIKENSIVRNDDNHIVHWAITKIQDVFGNNMKYTYTNGTLNGNGNLQGGTYFYCDTITYTGFNATDGDYQVKFNLDQTVKEDVTINGKLGLKWIDPYLLDTIEVTYQGNLIRSYELDYDLGRFTKNLLQWVAEKDKDGNEFYRHDFDYYDDVAANGGNLFKQAVDIDFAFGDFNPSFVGNLGGLIGTSSISTSENIETGFEVGIAAGIELNAAVTQTDDQTALLSSPFGISWFKSKGKVSLSDINGDGIEDIIVRRQNKLYFKSGILSPDGQEGNGLINSFEEGDFTRIEGVKDFYRSKGSSKTIFGESLSLKAYGFSATRRKVKTESEATTYFVDGNGDNLMDIVRDNIVYFNRINPNNGRPTFHPSSEETENMVITAAGIGGPPIDPVDPEDELPLDKLDFDAVRVWVAPRDGQIEFTDRVSAANPVIYSIESQRSDINSGTPFRIFLGQMGSTPTFVNLKFYENGAPKGLEDQGATDDPGLLHVKAGQRFYIRLHTTGTNPQVELASAFSYRPDATTLRDENGENIRDYIYPINFFLNSNTGYVYPGTGQASISFSPIYLPVTQTDDIHFKIIQNVYSEDGSISTSTLWDRVIAAGAVGDPTSSGLIQPILNDDPNKRVEILFQALTDNNPIRWTNINWNPNIVFTSGDGGFVTTDNSQTTYQVPDFSAFNATEFTPVYFHKLEASNWQNAPQGSITVKALPGILTDVSTIFDVGDTGNFHLLIKNSRQVFGRIGIEVLDGTMTTIGIGEAIKVFEGDINENVNDIARNLYIGYYADGVQNKALVKKYIEATTFEKSVKFSYDPNWINANKSYYHNSIEYYRNDLPTFGQVYRGWGHFFYNESQGDEDFIGDNYGQLIDPSILENPFYNGYINPDDFDSGALGLPPGEPTTGELETLFDDLETQINNGQINFPEIAVVSGRANRNPTISRGNRWIGLSRDQFSTSKVIQNANFGGGGGGASGDGAGNSGPFAGILVDADDEFGGLDADPFVGMNAIKKIEKGATVTYAGGYGSTVANQTDNVKQNSSRNNKYSRTISDYRDVNGDGYPDAIYEDRVTKTNMTGGHIGQQMTDFGDTGNAFSTGTSFSSSSGAVNDIRNIAALIKKAPAGTPAGGGEAAKSTSSGDATSEGSGTEPAKLWPPSANIGINVNVNASTKEKATFTDINGDGLADRVSINDNTGVVSYRLNRGGFTNMESGAEIFPSLDKLTISKPRGINLSAGIGGGISNFSQILDAPTNESMGNALAGSFNFSVGIAGSAGTTEHVLMDINGDGLVDRVTSENTIATVRFNLGKEFGPEMPITAAQSFINPNLKLASRSRSLAASLNAGFYFGFTIPPALALWIKFGINAGGSMSLSVSDVEKSFLDFNGDGFTDFVQADGPDFNVNYSAIGRTNKLMTVHNPLGGSFTVDYNAQPKTYDNPNAKWVMKSVTVDDGYHDIVNDGIDQYVTEFRYEGGRFDRREREFYGYETVKVFDYRDENLDNVYRTTTTEYHVDNYYLQGLVKLSKVATGGSADLGFASQVPDSRFSQTENEYTLYGLQEGNQAVDLTNELDATFDVGGKEGRGTAVAVLTKTTSRVIERTANEMVSEITIEYDELARVSSYTNHGDVQSPNDDYTTDITYHSTPELDAKNLIQIPFGMVVSIGSEEFRERFTSNIDPMTGTVGMVSARVDNDDLFTETQMTYDQYGNLETITYPENAHGDAMSYTYTYDTSGKYLIETQDAFGYSASASFDPEFDTLLETIDMSGTPMRFFYDNYGRTTKVQGPKEIDAGIDFTINYSYYTRWEQLNGIATIAEEDFMPVGLTQHYDVQHPDNTINTYTFVDGLARAIQVKKDIRYTGFDDIPGSGEEKLSVSGKTTYDHLGRIIKAYHPWFENKDVDLNFKINNYANVTYYSETIYDELDRVKQTIDAAGNNSYMTYTVSGNEHITTSRVDQTNFTQIENRSYNDARGRKVKSVQVGPDGDLETIFTYNAIDELEAYTDADNITTFFEYDLLGRKTKRIHADNGTTEFFYDNASNVIKMQTEKLGIAGDFITYDYEYNRLIKSNFPDGPGGEENLANVTLVYGMPNSGFETGRVISQQDATGIQEFLYGNMGELIHNTRTIVAPDLQTRTFVTEFEYDSWNRLQSVVYPDQEEVVYTYDVGGKLQNVTGEVNGAEYEYVENINYDYFGSTISKKFGNDTRMTYSYEPALRRLSKSVLFDSANKKLLDNHYSYNKASNVTKIKNLAGSNNEYNLGGYYTHTYSYDVLNRLAGANGGFSGNGFAHPEAFRSDYNLTMEYTNSHGIANKKQSHNTNNVAVDANTYNRAYTYTPGTHQLETIEEPSLTKPNNGFVMSFIYDPNGNTINVQDTDGNDSDYFWDEANRLRVVNDQTTMQHYIYDGGDQRVLKSSSDPTVVNENGSPVKPQAVQFDNYTTYPSNLIVVKPDGEYTKHYFAGSERILSRIGDVDTDFPPPTTGDGGIGKILKSIRQRQIQDLQKTTLNAGLGTVSFKEYVSEKDKETQATEEASTNRGPVLGGPSVPEAGNIYYFHGDHLGTASFITDAAGDAYQFFANLPFGETMIEQKNTEVNDDYENRWKFNGKELDTETGLYYYGARYYNPSTSIWLSVDAMADAMPSWNPYNYTMQNPINLIDPDGNAPTDWYRNKLSNAVKWVDGSENIDGYENIGFVYGHTDAYNSRLVLDGFTKQITYRSSETGNTTIIADFSDQGFAPEFQREINVESLKNSHVIDPMPNPYDFKNREEISINNGENFVLYDNKWVSVPNHSEYMENNECIFCGPTLPRGFKEMQEISEGITNKAFWLGAGSGLGLGKKSKGKPKPLSPAGAVSGAVLAQVKALQSFFSRMREHDQRTEYERNKKNNPPK